MIRRVARMLRLSVYGFLVWRFLAPVIKPEFKPPQEHPWRLEGKTVYVGDDEFVVRQAGPEDGAPILLVHGLAGSSLGEWYLIGQKLATERRVVMVDCRGHGLSTASTERHEVGELADDIAAVLDQLGIEAVDVVGYSMGGAVAQALARRHPGRVARLVLVATFAAHPETTRRMRGLGVLLTRGWERIAGVGASEARMGYLLATGVVEPQYARWLWEELRRRSPDAGAQSAFALLRFDSRSWVGKLGIPTMVVIPGEDLLVPPAWQYELAGLIPGVKVVEIPDGRHEVVWTHADLLVSEFREFLV